MTNFFSQGIDIVEVERIKKVVHKYNYKFLEKIFSNKEIEIFKQLKLYNESTILKIAGRFAAKEAASKALGTGLRKGIKFSDFEITNDINGQPLINFKGQAKETLNKYKKIKSTVTISNEKLYAVALVTLVSF